MAEGEVSTAVSSAVSTAATAKWFDGYDAETQAYITSRGLADKDPAQAFLDAAKAHREAQAYIGVPKEQLLKLPKADAAPEEWDAVYEKLGYSKNAADYAFADLKAPDGTEVEEGFKDFIRAQAAALKLSPAAAQKLAEAALKFGSDAEASEAASTQTADTKALEGLVQDWGANYQANMVIADRAFQAIMQAAGFDKPTMDAAINKLGEVSGKAQTLQMLLAIGTRMSEDTFTGSGIGTGIGSGMARTATDAKAQLSELTKDSEWTKRLLAGGTAEVRQFNSLSEIAAGGQ